MKIGNTQICRIVRDAIDMANRMGENWADVVDDALVMAGVEIHDEQPDGRDHDTIVRLADGREVYCTNGDYGITDFVWEYWCQIDGGEGGEATIHARNWWEAKRKATEWAQAGDWKQAGPVTVHITQHHKTESFTVQVEPCKS